MSELENLEDEVPPLEDIPNMNTNETNFKQAYITKPLNSNHNDSTISKETTPVTATVATSTASVTASSTTASSSFGGFKKGFLNSSKTKTSPNNASSSAVTSTSKQSEMVYLKANASSKTDSKIFSDIKDAIKEETPAAAWLNDDLLVKIEKNEILKRGFTNPRLIDKISKFQKNPQEALKECQNDQEAVSFLMEFMKLMGNHLTDETFINQNQATNIKTHDEIKKADIEDSEQKKVNELINNEEVRSLLMDKDVQNLFYLLKNNPENSQKIIKSANGQMQVKIQKLIKFGLLSIQN